MLKMIQKLIGEDIDLSWLLDKELWPIKMDPAQIDQIIANLCVNTRDAIDGVGKVVIKTENVVFSPEYCANNQGFSSGDFVHLTVSDDGCGMDKETMANIFEPFFTTKDINKGTGLGLSMVYGIVKQNNGFIIVESELGEGTRFSIYLTRHPGIISETEEEGDGEIPSGNNETILVVEDELQVLKLAKINLEKLGYSVFTASKPADAIRIVQESKITVNLLLTDVIMPEMNGRDLLEKLKDISPHLKHVFMSGYTADIIVDHGVLDEGESFLQKPFSKMDLALAIKKALKKE